MRGSNCNRIVAAAALCALLAGCAVNREDAGEAFGLGPSETPEGMQFVDEAIAHAWGERAPLPVPASVALYQRAAPCPEYDIRENEDIEALSDALKNLPDVAEVFILSQQLLTRDVSIENLRLAAARHHADLTLLVDTDLRTRVEPTALVLLNLAIVPAYLVPSAGLEVETRVRAHLVDTRNGHIYYSTQKTKRWRTFMPIARTRRAVLANRKRLVEETFQEIATEIDERLTEAAP